MLFRFVAGKGGVGKTTLAAARAVALAEAAGASGAGAGPVLVVSTDPAHSLGDALDSDEPLGGEPREVAPNLLAAELAAAPAYARWLGERRASFQTLAERGTWLAPDDVARLLDLPVPGVDELIGLLELVRMAGEAGCERVVVDTAPTAHTLRLLAMPAALERIAAVLAALRDRHRAVADAFSGGSWRGDEADAAAEELAGEARALGTLIRDPDRARFTWVLLPEALSLAESEDALVALRRAGVRVDELVVNRVAPPTGARETRAETTCGTCAARRRAEAEAIRRVHGLAPEGARVLAVPEADAEPRGAEALREIWRSRLPVEDLDLPEPGEAPPAVPDDAPLPDPPAWLEALPEGLKALPEWLKALVPPERRLLMLGGKGGVGKTTCAAAIALLAARASSHRPVLLLSTDPAHTLGDVLEAELSDEERPVAGAPALRARELDAAAAFARLEARYRDALESAFSGPARSPGGRSGSAAKGIDAPLDRAVVERLFEATPPGLDELVALAELGDLTGPETDEPGRLVIVDTAPTGHALRLLELPEIALEWDHALLSILLEYRDAVGLPAGLARELVDLSKSLKRLRALLSDPARCGFVVVTRTGELPARETRRLAASLRDLGTAVPAVIVNAVPAGDCGRCRRRGEAPDLGWSPDGGPDPPAILTAPAEYPPPRGVRALERWAHRWRRPDRP